MLFRRPLRSALSISVALAQIGEFSFILAALASELNLLPLEATSALVVSSVVSITLNPMLYKCVEPVVRWLERAGIAVEKPVQIDDTLQIDDAAHRVIVVGYGPVGRTLSRILEDNGIQVVVVETNLQTVQDLRAKGELAVYGDASLREVLHHAGIEKADGLIIAASSVSAHTVVKAARELNPAIRVLTRTAYLREAEKLREAGANAVFSSEGEVALAMSAFLMRQLGATDEQIDRERDRVRAELFREAERGGAGRLPGAAAISARAVTKRFERSRRLKSSISRCGRESASIAWSQWRRKSTFIGCLYGVVERSGESSVFSVTIPQSNLAASSNALGLSRKKTRSMKN
jgi:CPA2 family monovalent cation:H+ antiporter-2